MPEINRKEDSNVRWDITNGVMTRVQANMWFEEVFTPGSDNREKRLYGREIISRDTPVNGRIYLDGAGKEAIIVDDEKDLELRVIFRLVENAIIEGERTKELSEVEILNLVWKTVREKIPYQKKHADKIIESLPRQDTPIYLSAFIGGGICRHQALLAAYLLEALIKQKDLRGTVSLDRNYIQGKIGHAWARYKNRQGTIYIIDPAQGFVGDLSDAAFDRSRWFYERPDDNPPKPPLIKRIRIMLAGT